MIDRVETVAEEFASSISHGIGLLGSLAALPLLVLATRRHKDPWLMTGVVIFGASLVLLYLASTLYHALPPSRAKRICRILDHSAIYLLIAGTYAPFTLGPLRGPWGYSLLTVVWFLALLGMITKNAVILIGQIEAERAERKDVWQAAIDASSARFRPIMLTAISTVLGMIPIAPTVPGLGGTITSAPVWRATAAARASAAKGIPWQKTTLPTGRLPFTRFR